MPQLASIHIYPIKSLDGISIQECRVLPGGALEHDRMLAFFDLKGSIVNGKRNPAVHQLRTTFDLHELTVEFTSQSLPSMRFHLLGELTPMAEWLSEYFGFSVRVQCNQEGGFPDDLDSPGPTVLSTETLESINQWFPTLPMLEIRRRFRANLEIQAREAFWEDRLYTSDRGVPFKIGDVEFLGTNPCQRCIVPTRSPETGEPMSDFGRNFAEQREKSLPAWAARNRFDHYYRLAINTRLAALNSGRLRVGDEVQLLS